MELKRKLELPGISTIVSHEDFALWPNSNWDILFGRTGIASYHPQAVLIYRAPWDRSLSAWAQYVATWSQTNILNYWAWCADSPKYVHHDLNNDHDMFMRAAKTFGRQNVKVASYDSLLEQGVDAASYIICTATLYLYDEAWNTCARQISASKGTRKANVSPSPAAVDVLRLLRQVRDKSNCPNVEFPNPKRDDTFGNALERVAAEMPVKCTSFRHLYMHEWDAYFTMTGIQRPHDIPDKKPCFVDIENMTQSHWLIVKSLLPDGCSSHHYVETENRPYERTCYR